MPNDESELEKYLSEFRPRQVRPLEMSKPVTSQWSGRLAAAAVVLLSVTAGLWYARHPWKTPLGAHQPVSRLDSRVEGARPNTIALTRLALENENEFEVELAAESRTVLPDFQGQQSTLRVLAKE
jgi:hypothetical protein